MSRFSGRKGREAKLLTFVARNRFDGYVSKLQTVCRSEGEASPALYKLFVFYPKSSISTNVECLRTYCFSKTGLLFDKFYAENADGVEKNGRCLYDLPFAWRCGCVDGRSDSFRGRGKAFLTRRTATTKNSGNSTTRKRIRRPCAR